MNTVNLARNYAVLTPEERFRLIVAAGGRGDDAEQSRLCQAGKSISLRMPDYSPWSHAFEELTMVVLLELLDDVARHHEAFERWCDACHGDEGESKGGGSQDAMIGRMWDLYRVQGFILKSKIAGWKLFCRGLSLPPFTPWQCLPGFARLEHAMDCSKPCRRRHSRHGRSLIGCTASAPPRPANRRRRRRSPPKSSPMISIAPFARG
jgi:hypothetical protein